MPPWLLDAPNDTQSLGLGGARGLMVARDLHPATNIRKINTATPQSRGPRGTGFAAGTDEGDLFPTKANHPRGWGAKPRVRTMNA